LRPKRSDQVQAKAKMKDSSAVYGSTETSRVKLFGVLSQGHVAAGVGGWCVRAHRVRVSDRGGG
jgi:hypothetical protein